jgi:hypothetical protein
VFSEKLYNNARKSRRGDVESKKKLPFRYSDPHGNASIEGLSGDSDIWKTPE